MDQFPDRISGLGLLFVGVKVQGEHAVVRTMMQEQETVRLGCGKILAFMWACFLRCSWSYSELVVLYTGLRSQRDNRRCGRPMHGLAGEWMVWLCVQEELVHEVWAMAANLEKEYPEIHTQPQDVLCCSAETGEGVDQLRDSIRGVLQGDEYDGDEDVFDWDTSLPEAHPEGKDRF